MGEQWLSDVTAALRESGWRTESGYPGTAAVQLEGAVAAVNLSRGNTKEASVGITVSVLVPRTAGLAQCQTLAAQAAVLLSGVGGDWCFEGWTYDSTLDCFRVEVEGNAVLSALEEGTAEDGGYEVLIGETVQRYVTEFSAKKDAQRRLVRPHGQSGAVGVTPGMDGWSIELVQLLPDGEAEPEETADTFSLTVQRGGSSMCYIDCCWAEYESRQGSDGVQVVRRGFALSREVS